MLDRRIFPRDRVIFGGTIATDAKNQNVDCVVRNISDTGVNIELPNSVNVPNELRIIIPRIGKSFLAKIVWWRANRAGLAFQAPNLTKNSQTLDFEERLRISERKARALKQRVRQLLGEA